MSSKKKRKIKYKVAKKVVYQSSGRGAKWSSKMGASRGITKPNIMPLVLTAVESPWAQSV